MFVAKQFKGTGNKVRPGEGDVLMYMKVLP